MDQDVDRDIQLPGVAVLKSSHRAQGATRGPIAFQKGQLMLK